MALLTINQTGSIISSLNIRDIEDIEIPGLSKAEQERMSELLFAWQNSFSEGEKKGQRQG